MIVSMKKCLILLGVLLVLAGCEEIPPDTSPPSAVAPDR